jgi:hypothetical protein
VWPERGSEEELMKSKSLYQYRKNYYSQNGEDGIIREILKRLDIKNGFCIEFGAWDGKHLSNTYYLVEICGWKGLYIEGDPNKFADLLKNTMVLAGKIIPVNAYVGLKGESLLDCIIAKYNVQENFDLLSIDIDSYDLDIWKSVTKFRPKVVIIEIDSDIEPTLSRILPDGRAERSFANMLKLGHQKGYSLVCHTGNMIFVVNELVDKLNMAQELSDPNKLFCDRWIREKNSRLIRFSNRILGFGRKLMFSGNTAP